MAHWIDRLVVVVALVCAVLLVVPWFVMADMQATAQAIIAYGLAPSLVAGHVLLALQAGGRSVWIVLLSLLALAAVLCGAYLLHAFGSNLDDALANTDRSTRAMSIGFIFLFAAIGFAASGFAALLASGAGLRAGTFGRTQAVLAALTLVGGVVGVWLGTGAMFLAPLAGVGLLALWWLSVAVSPLLRRLAMRNGRANPA